MLEKSNQLMAGAKQHSGTGAGAQKEEDGVLVAWSTAPRDGERLAEHGDGRAGDGKAGLVCCGGHSAQHSGKPHFATTAGTGQ